MAITKIKSSNIADGTVVAADIADDSITNADIKSDAAIAMTKLAVDPTDASNITSGTLPTARLASVLDLSGKTVQLPAASVTAHATTPTLDSPVITGTLSVLPSDNVTHTIANWSDDVSYTITPTNCTVGAVNVSGQFVVTHTSGVPSYTIKATTASLGLADSALVTKNITLTLTAPTLSSPADVGTATDVVYTITSTDSNDDKLILDPGTANFTYQSESGPGTASKVGNTVECVGFGTGNPVVTIRFTAEATYSVTAKAVKIDGTYGTSANSSADSIVIQNWTGTVATGGAVSAGVTVGDYKVHTFIASGQFVITTLGTTPVVDFLVVAGGGGGGTGNGGGGGGGGLRNSYNNELSGGTGSSQTAITMAATGTYQITVGAGGPSTTNGIPSTAALSSTITTVGGGDGGDYNSGNGDLGGSGGGSSGNGSPGAGTPNEGYAGGGPSVGSDNRSNGGGGAGAVGLANQGNTSPGGAGGAGRQSNIDNNNWYWAGGGGGSSWGDSGSHGGAGGLGGGGGGSAYQDVAGAGGGSAKNSGANGTVGNGSNGAAAGVNTGGGGGGGAYSQGGGGAGGKGIVILRYQFQ